MRGSESCGNFTWKMAVQLDTDAFGRYERNQRLSLGRRFCSLCRRTGDYCC